MKPMSSHCFCQSGRGVTDSRSIQPPELCDDELEPKPPRLKLLLPTAWLPLRTAVDPDDVGLPVPR